MHNLSGLQEYADALCARHIQPPASLVDPVFLVFLPHVVINPLLGSTEDAAGEGWLQADVLWWQLDMQLGKASSRTVMATVALGLAVVWNASSRLL